MKNIINYVETVKTPFSGKAFNSVDSLVLSQLAYLNFDGLVSDYSIMANAVRLKDIAKAENWESLCSTILDKKKYKKLLRALTASPRYSKIMVNYYVNHVDYDMEKQFSAITFLLSDNTAYIAFRGTDSNLVGWKEDFNMAFSNCIPAQEESAIYLDTVGELVNCSIKVGGHSKGGNLAVYSAMRCTSGIQNRITDIYCHDGPGFREEVFLSPEYSQIKDRIRQLIPQSALVGMLLEHHEKYVVVKSNAIGILQHDPFSWQIKGDDFIYLENVDNLAMLRSNVIREWLSSISDEKRELFVNTLNTVIKATDAKTFSDLSMEKAIAALNAIRNIDEDTRRFVSQTIRSLISMSMKSIRPKLNLRQGSN